MQDLNFRKKLIWKEIEKIKSDLEKNQEFIALFQKNNNKLLASLSELFKELEKIGYEIHEKEGAITNVNVVGYIAGVQTPEPTAIGEKSLPGLTTGDTIAIGHDILPSEYCLCKEPITFAWQCLTCNKPVRSM